MFAYRLPPLPSIGDILKLYNLDAKKKLSQNFLLDNKLRSKLVCAGGKLKDCHVIEVGPGPGSLTRNIFQQKAFHVHVIEKDPRFLPTLELLKEATYGRLSIHIGDVLKFDMKPLIPEELKREWEGDTPMIRIIGNLPFSISTPLIFKWLEQISKRSDIWCFGRVPLTLTFQEEVAQRMVAHPCHFQRSRLSIMCQNWCEVDHKFVIPGRAFIPKPDVNVSVVYMTPRIKPLIDLDFKLVEKVVFAVFSQRGKYCKRGVERLFPEHLREELVKKLLIVSDIDSTKRPYELSMKDFDRIVHCYAALLEENPTLKKYI
ncbi:Dimethyladenosine transferase 1, mitochondrial [Armadillidium nasatum]|uniref:rRNA adenine N(6)-methyltransferase n=1 Tax=Armadillidium nasatum TaxID=96803 RepID=A0A5N5T252_9CRUS|nr:Dimethyladenosine transferase 1, mitochondrial [Armadillidium nasatum]KAB7500376.1 Dimethyladenosine transferase 1, mitochondrial [Armadillidium nasatum]